MIAPKIHWNGTSRRELLEQALAACEALRTVQERLAACSPNGRDYFSATELEQASSEAQDRQQRIYSVLMEMEALALAIADAEGPR